jgi:hypothetical protein
MKLFEQRILPTESNEQKNQDQLSTVDIAPNGEFVHLLKCYVPHLDYFRGRLIKAPVELCQALLFLTGFPMCPKSASIENRLQRKSYGVFMNLKLKMTT